MTPEHWQRIKQVLEPALEVESSSRSTFLDRACAGDNCLRQEVESLISYEIAGANVLQRISVEGFDTGDEAVFHLAPGKRVGAFEIIGEIGFGGMGAVYRAARADGQYKQQVALKIVRADLGSLTAERFRNERQILASLDHPNIARILDGGATIDGLPYLVMELIEGLPITDYCDQHKLSIDERLKMFRAVCSAVHYAHQHLVIHRDIKPSNILATADGTPKLLDFGIAKILDPNLLPQNQSLTAAGLWMMTPEYASPEQFRGETVTTATDIYSLGLVLYELLTGRPAYRLSSHLPHEVARIVLETDPEKPSAAIARGGNIAGDAKTETFPTPESVGQLRGSSPQKLQQRLRGDLDNIVLKAIRKEPQERYSSADQLSEDIRRYQEHLPVLARNSTLAYRCRKYLLRHKAGVAAAALVLLSLLTGITLSWREARIAQRRFNDVRKLANSLIFEVHDSIRALPGAMSARKLILQRAQEYLDSLAKDASSDPSLLRELATAYARVASVVGDLQDANFGKSELALQDYLRAADLRQQAVALLPNDNGAKVELASSFLDVAVMLGQKRDNKREREYLDKASTTLSPICTSEQNNKNAWHKLGKSYELRGFLSFRENNLDGAIQNHRKSLEIYKRLADQDPHEASYQTEVAYAHKHLGALLGTQGHWRAALEEYQAALPVDERQLKADPANVSTQFAITFTYSDMGWILRNLGDLDSALVSYRKAVAIRSRLAQQDPQDARSRWGLANNYNEIARILWKKDALWEALNNEQQAYKLRKALLDTDPTNTLKQIDVLFSEASVGEAYEKLAFSLHSSAAQKFGLCRQAASWLGKSIPELNRRKSELPQRDASLFIPEIQAAADRCNLMLK